MLKLFKRFKPYIGMLFCVVFFIALGSFAEIYLPSTIERIIDVGIVNSDKPYILKQSLYMFASIAVSAFGAVMIGYFAAKISSGIGRDLRAEVFKKAESFSLNEFDSFGASSLITRTTNDITQFQNFSVMFMRVVVKAPIMSVGSIIMAIATNPKMSVYVLASIPILALTISLVAKKVIPMFSAVQKKIDRLNQITRENLTGMRVVKAFLKTDYEIERFDEANDDLTKTSIKIMRIMGGLMPAMLVLMNAVVIIVMWVGADLIVAKGLEVGELIKFTQYINNIMFAIMMLSVIFVMLPRAIASAKRINEVLETEPSVVDGEGAVSEGKGEIEFKNVTFTYPNADEPVLKNISFKAHKGETTAFIGSTGSGKSTIINLIPRFYDVSEGEILIDGADIRSYSLKALRDKIGFVPQRGVLFSGTIADNLRFGREDATDEELVEAAKVSQSYDFIMAKENGFSEHISQGGTNVSGGQKQRLSIARALVKKAEIYIFDDSFSALDFKTDAALRKDLKGYTENSTVLIVAQRVSTIMDADRIVVLGDGEVVGIGTHKELLKSSPVYREICLSQLSKEEIE